MASPRAIKQFRNIDLNGNLLFDSTKTLTGTYFVSKSGNNATAVKGDINRPWLTLDAVVIAAESLNSSVIVKYVGGTATVTINGTVFSGTTAALLGAAIDADATLIASVSGNNITVTPQTGSSFILNPATCNNCAINSRVIYETATIIVFAGDYTCTTNLFKDGVNWTSIGQVNISRSGNNSANLFEVEYHSATGSSVQGNFNLTSTGNCFNYVMSSAYQQYVNVITCKFHVSNMVSTGAPAISLYADLNPTVSTFDFNYVTATSSGGEAVYIQIITALQNININCVNSKSTFSDGVRLHGCTYNGGAETTVSTKYAMLLISQNRVGCKLLSTGFKELSITGYYNHVLQTGNSISSNIAGSFNKVISYMLFLTNTGTYNEFDCHGSPVDFNNSGSCSLRNFSGTVGSTYIYGYSRISNSGNLVLSDFILDGATGMAISLNGGVLTLDCDWDLASNQSIYIYSGKLIVKGRVRNLTSTNANTSDYLNCINFLGGSLVLRGSSALVVNSAGSGLSIAADIARNIKVYGNATNEDYYVAKKKKTTTTVAGTWSTGDIIKHTVNGTLYSYAVQAGNTIAQIISGMVAALGAASTTVTATAFATTYDIEAVTAGTTFTSSSTKTSTLGTTSEIPTRTNHVVPTNLVTGGTTIYDTDVE